MRTPPEITAAEIIRSGLIMQAEAYNERSRMIRDTITAVRTFAGIVSGIALSLLICFAYYSLT